MNESEPNFESLRRLLALKRHETPPPGYFNNFSRQVIARVRAGEAEVLASPSEQLFGSISWWFKLLQSLETRPVFAGTFATMLCSLLLFGTITIMAQRPESVSQAILQPPPQDVTPLVASATSPALSQPVNQFLIADNSTNPVVNFSSPSFGPSPALQPVGFPISGN